jgi:hypothetical protein
MFFIDFPLTYSCSAQAKLPTESVDIPVHIRVAGAQVGDPQAFFAFAQRII